jgi:hypothetical protein
MPTLAANILMEAQVVQFDLGAKTQALPCRVLGFGGTSVVLAPIGELTEATLEALQPDRDAYVIVDAGGQIHALRARVREGSDAREIVVSVTDGFQLGQRRRYSRAPIALPARLRALPGGETWESATRDLSAGGLRLARHGVAGEEADALEVVLEAARAGLRIRAEAAVVRRSPLDLSLRFTEIAASDVALLQQIAVAYYRLA